MHVCGCDCGGGFNDVVALMDSISLDIEKLRMLKQIELSLIAVYFIGVIQTCRLAGQCWSHIRIFMTHYGRNM